MDNRCPICEKDLGRRKLAYSVVARMDVDCPHCSGGLTANVHPAERALVLGGTAVAAALAAASYVMQSQALLVATLGVAAAAAATMQLLERVGLRDWPRYIARLPRPGME